MKMEDEYSYDSFHLNFLNKNINDKYILRCKRAKIDLKILIPLFAFCLSVLPLSIQIRFINGSHGIGWLLSAYTFILSPFVLMSIIALELLRDKIEKMEISRRTYYYKFKENATVFYVFLHAIATSLALYLRATNICDKSKVLTVFDKPMCVDQLEMPWDTFTITFFFTILYRTIFTHPIIYTYICQVITFFAVMLALIETTSLEVPTSVIMCTISIALYFVISYFLYYLKIHSMNNFIMEDRIRVYDSSHYNNSKIYHQQYYYQNDGNTQPLDSAIFYHNENQHPIRKVLSDSRINYENEINNYEYRSRSSSITSVDLTF